MKVYLVGGSVRDKLLGKVPRDTDYLVVDSSESELLAKGYVKVGQSFPIFLDTSTGDEYSLSLSIEDDMKRRDLTINAMAMDEAGGLIDLKGGEVDLRNKILRHVERENFFSDPLRVMRVARFQAQFQDFTIHPDTVKLMTEVAATSGYQVILSERIIKELKRVFETPAPSLFFKTLMNVGGLAPHFPEGEMRLLDQVKRVEDIQFAAYVTTISPDELQEIRKRLNIENAWYETARAWILYQRLDNTPEALLEYFYAIDAFRKPGLVSKMHDLGAKDLGAFEIIKDVGINDIDQSLSGKDIADAIRAKRLDLLTSRS